MDDVEDDNDGDVPSEENLIGASVADFMGERMTTGEEDDDGGGSIPLAGDLFFDTASYISAKLVT